MIPTKKAAALFRNMPAKDFQALWQFGHRGGQVTDFSSALRAKITE
jgi:hypothetical protein